TRDAAIARLSAALRAYPILGVTTNVPFLIRILDSPVFRDGRIDTRFLDRNEHGLVPAPASDIPAIVQAALEAAVPFDGAAVQGSSAPDRDPWSAASGWRP